MDLGAAWRKFVLGDQSADVLPGYDNVKVDFSKNTGRFALPIDATIADAPGGSKYVSDKPSDAGQGGDGSTVTGQLIGGGGGGSQYAPLNQAAIDAINSSMGQLGTLRDQQLAEEQGKYDNLIKRYQDEAVQNQQKYDTDLLTTNQNHAKNLMQSLYAGSGGLQSLLSILRGQGAGQGTARDLVFDTVGSQTARDIASGDQTRNENASALDNFLNTFLSQDRNRRDEAEQTRRNNENAIRANELTQRQGFYNKLADIYGDAGNTSQAQRYAADAIGLNPDITRLSNRGVAQYTPVESTVQAPNLGSYSGPTQSGVSASGGQGGLGSGVFTLGDFRRRLQGQGV